MYRRLPLLLLVPLAACQQPAQPATNQVGATAAPAPTPTVSPPARADLTRYVGHYPLDGVEGDTFLSDAQVRAGVASAVPDAAVRARVLDPDVTATPIVMAQGRVLSYGCEPHNCGPHNWAVAITPDGREAAVCYHDEERGVSRWYPAGFAPAPTGGCPSGDE
jgi:hypothetical protein